MKKEVIAEVYLTYRLYIFPIVVAVASLGLIVLIIIPQISSLISNQKVGDQLSHRFKTLEVKAKDLETYDSLDLSQKVSYALSAFPAEKDFINVIGLIQNLVSQSGFTVINLALGSQSSKALNTDSYTIKLEVSGSKILAANLFSSIESSTRIMKIDNIEISNAQNSQATDILININVLYSPSPASFGSIDSPLPKLSQKDEDLLAKLAGVSPFSPPDANVQLPSRGKANPFE